MFYKKIHFKYKTHPKISIKTQTQQNSTNQYPTILPYKPNLKPHNNSNSKIILYTSINILFKILPSNYSTY